MGILMTILLVAAAVILVLMLAGLIALGIAIREFWKIEDERRN